MNDFIIKDTAIHYLSTHCLRHRLRPAQRSSIWHQSNHHRAPIALPASYFCSIDRPSQARRRWRSRYQATRSLIVVTSTAREDELRPVRVPLSRGLNSYFYNWVRKEDVERYSDIETLNELTQLSVLQGTNWATIPGLEENSVKMLAAKRADALLYSAIHVFQYYKRRHTGALLIT
ncbi:hypothetical protein OAM69_05330 [bacterium]|nr:hypothetical protein [bacterium]